LALVCVMQVCGGDRYSVVSLITGQRVAGPLPFVEVQAFLTQQEAA
jgi:hypothetical protein